MTSFDNKNLIEAMVSVFNEINEEQRTIDIFKKEIDESKHIFICQLCSL